MQPQIVAIGEGFDLDKLYRLCAKEWCYVAFHTKAGAKTDLFDLQCSERLKIAQNTAKIDADL